MKHDTWHMTHEIWHVTPDTWTMNHEHFIVLVLLSAHIDRFSVSRVRKNFPQLLWWSNFVVYISHTLASIGEILKKWYVLNFHLLRMDLICNMGFLSPIQATSKELKTVIDINWHYLDDQVEAFQVRAIQGIGIKGYPLTYNINTIFKTRVG